MNRKGGPPYRFARSATGRSDRVARKGEATLRMTVEFRTFGIAEIAVIAPEGITRDEIAERFSESVLRSAWGFVPSEIGTVSGAAGWMATLDDFDVVVDRVFVNVDVDEVGVEADDDGTPDVGGFSDSLC